MFYSLFFDVWNMCCEIKRGLNDFSVSFLMKQKDEMDYKLGRLQPTKTQGQEKDEA